jgi:hypothetical protein
VSRFFSVSFIIVSSSPAFFKLFSSGDHFY